MKHETSNQGWQQLQSHIEGFFGQALRNDTRRIEYKPRFIDHLLEMPSEHLSLKSDQSLNSSR
jgi:hypothetical protein